MLDPNATPFTRIWCCFEQATVAQGRRLKLDMVTVCDVPEKNMYGEETGRIVRECFLLTDGPANGEEECPRTFLILDPPKLESAVHSAGTLLIRTRGSRGGSGGRNGG